MRDLARGRVFTPRVVLGLALIALGVVFTLDNLGLGDAWSVFWLYGWPAALMLAGLSKLLWPASDTGRGFGLVLFSLGVLVLLGRKRLGVLPIRIWDLLPAALVLIGLLVLWRGLFGARGQRGRGGDTREVNTVAVLGGNRRSNGSDDFRGGDLVAIMGGVTLDLSHAAIQDHSAVIDVFAMWGGVEIVVPRGWDVALQGLPLLGSFEDNTAPPDQARGQLVVKGFAIMGGVEVKNG